MDFESHPLWGVNLGNEGMRAARRTNFVIESVALRSDGNEYHGEFDPGSERTLAARFKHASRTVVGCLHPMRVANG